MASRIVRFTAGEGLELPVVDVTHPHWSVDLDPTILQGQMSQFLADRAKFARLPSLLRRLITAMFLRRSLVGRGILASRGTFMGPLETYLLKLLPDDLGKHATQVDRKILSSLPAVAMRKRLQDMAHLLAGALAPSLRAAPGRPLRFLNLAGGTAMDTLNALLVLRGEDGALLDRPITVDVLDAGDVGPELGGRALRALQAEGASLNGFSIVLRHVAWDWSTDGGALATAVTEARAAGAIAIASSEGGLFEYGEDDEILDALAHLRFADMLGIAGSVTRADEPVRLLHADGGAAIRPRGLEAFRALVEPEGWSIARVIEGPFSDQMLLVPAGAA